MVVQKEEVRSKDGWCAVGRACKRCRPDDACHANARTLATTRTGQINLSPPREGGLINNIQPGGNTDRQYMYALQRK